MSFVFAVPELLSTAAGDLVGVQSVLGAANAAAAADTTALLAAGADEVSTAVAALYSAYGREYQALSGELAAFMTDSCGR